MTIKTNYSLKKHNTFGVDVKAKYFLEYTSPDDIDILKIKGILTENTNILILGEGSNLLLTKNIDGVVIYPKNKKIKIIKTTEENVFIYVEAGKSWDEFVEYAVNNNYGGIENLSGIPGHVGATPVQNIGAYGTEAKDVIYKVNVIDLRTGKKHTLTNEECEFNYRSSIFKTKLKNKYIIDSVIFKLQKTPKYNTTYGKISEELKKFEQITLKNIRKAILTIRNSKLPDPKKIGNAGSFFKNPIIDQNLLHTIQVKHKNIVYYNLPNNKVKVAAGWLIEQAGLKGYVSEKKTVAVHNKQALVIINNGGANGNDIVDIANYIQEKVFLKFNINLEPEVIYI